MAKLTEKIPFMFGHLLQLMQITLVPSYYSKQ